MPKILIVDDEKLIRESIKHALSSGEHELAEAANGSDAFNIIQAWSPDLVLADINMYPVNGYELVEKIRRNPACITTRIVLITGQHDSMAFRLGMNEGADDYLAKPFYVNELLKCVASQLARQMSYRSAIQNALRKITSILPQELIDPLSGMLNTVQSISTNAIALENEELRQEAQSLENQAKKLQRTVENFLLFSQVQAYDQAPKGWTTQGDCFYSKNLFEKLTRKEAAFWQRGSDLNLELSDVPVMVAADLLEKIMLEILSNAFKFSPAGSTVNVKTICSDGRCVIQVENSGSGMSPHQIESIGAFVRFGPATKERQGSGLGLFLAKRLTEIHGGEFSIESDPENFTRVSISLPCKAV